MKSSNHKKCYSESSSDNSDIDNEYDYDDNDDDGNGRQKYTRDGDNDESCGETIFSVSRSSSTIEIKNIDVRTESTRRTSLTTLASLTNNLNFHDDLQFSRSSVGGSKYLINAHINVTPNGDDLIFESRFESGNLAKAIKVTPVYYELYLRADLYTNKHTQWFYFRVINTRKSITYRYSCSFIHSFFSFDLIL